MDYRTKIIKWFVDNSSVDEEEILHNLDSNYFEVGWIDSFQFIEFLAFLEEDMRIIFENDAFQDRDFANINGLVRIIENIKNV